MPIKRGIEKGKTYYQYGASGKKHFYITGDKTSRDKARANAMKESDTRVNRTGGKIKKEIIPIWGGELARFNTQTPERMAEIQTKYKGQAHPDFIDRYADILNQPPKMMGWRNGVSRSEWYPEEKAAYLRDGSPVSKREVIRISGNNWNNMDELNQLRGAGLNISDRMYRPILTPVPKNANVYSGRMGSQHG